MAEVTGASRRALEGKLNIAPRTVTRRLKPMLVTPSDGHDPDVHQDYLLGLVIMDETTQDTLRHLTPESVSGEVRQSLLGYLLEHLGQKFPDPLPESLQNSTRMSRLFYSKPRLDTVQSTHQPD